MILTGALLLTLAWGAFAFGAVYAWAYVPLGLACLVVGAIGFLPRRDVNLGRPNAPLAAGLLLVALAVAVQLVPLPRETLVRLSPGTDSFLRRYDLQYAAALKTERLLLAGDASIANGARPPRAAPRNARALPDGRIAHPLSIDPAQTRLALGLLAVFAVFLTGLTRGLTARDIRTFVPWLVAAGVVLALVAIVQRAGFNGKIYGFWVPEAGLRPFGETYGPFVNRNHFAGWMVMALPLGVGYFCALVSRAMRGVKPRFHDRLVWFSSAEANRVILVAAGLAVMAVALVLTFSRSGITCFVVALAICGSAIARRQRRASRRAVVTGYLVFLAVLAIGWAGIDVIAARFGRLESAFVHRAAIWNDALRVSRDFPVFGSGLDTFGTAMLVYQTADQNVWYTEAHNDYVQLLSEGGLLVAVPAVVLLVLFVREVRRRFRDDTHDDTIYWMRVGAVAGLIAIGLQETGEFSLQMPGNAALCCTLMAIAAGRLPHRTAARPVRPARDGF